MQSSGDLLADRRYAYAQAAFKEGDLEAAGDLARQVIEIAPRFAPAWFLLGEAREAQYRAARSSDEAVETYRDAIAAFDMALLRNPADPQGARLRLASLGIGDPLEAMSLDYVRALFDDYAIRFERHLTRSLKYRGPALLHDAVRRAASRLLRDVAFGEALDLGCGTGLAGETFRPHCRRLAGVDLSPAMIARARDKGIYDELAAADLVEWLVGRSESSADLVLAADVFIYLGDLTAVFAEAARVLAKGGLFAFTAQAHDGRGVILGSDLRYAYGEAYLDGLAVAQGLRVVLSEEVSTREDRGRPVPERLMVMVR